MKYSGKQQRETKQRRLVYNTVLSHTDHPSADEVFADIHRNNPKISKATVYRNLKILSNNGDILHVKVPGADRYDLTVKTHNHIYCIKCGKVIDSPIEYISENDIFVENTTGWCIKRHRTLFEGICPECNNNPHC